MFNAKQQILNNGINLITIKKDTQIISVQMGLKIGSLYEKKQEKGISHFIEHMLFKGTQHRSNEELNNDLESLGGDYNAYTDHDCTVYTITALSEELERSIELLSDMLKNSNFPEDEIEKERGVILAEIRTSKDDVEDYSFKKINEIAFNKSPLKYDIIGTEGSVKSFSKEELLRFYKMYYVPNNCFISIVSPFEHEVAQNLIHKYFDDWLWREFKRNSIIVENNKSIRVESHKNDIEQSTIVYLFTFYELTKDEELVLKVLNHKFGESANSILFRELREERGLAYDVYTHMDTTNKVKTLYIYTAVAEENVDEALKVIEECINKIIDRIVVFDQNTIKLMNKILKTAVVSTMEDSTDLSNYALHQLIDEEDIYDFINDMKKIENINSEDIYKVAQKVFKNPTVHILKS